MGGGRGRNCMSDWQRLTRGNVEDWGWLWGPVEWAKGGEEFSQPGKEGKVSQLHSLSIAPSIGPGPLIC